MKELRFERVSMPWWLEYGLLALLFGSTGAVVHALLTQGAR